MEGPEGATPADGGRGDVRGVELSTLLLLLSLLCFAAFALLEPLIGFAVFGSDSGEYYRLTQILLAQGHLPVGGAYDGGYGGWGYGYPDFPGLFLVAGAGAQGMALGVQPSLELLLPLVSAAAVMPLFLLFRRIYPGDTVAVLGAGFATVAMPRLFSLAHPAPLALGDLLCVGALWMFVEGRRDPRWYLPLALTSGALIVTHHLSSYFFLVSASGSLLLLELWRPRAWSRRFPLRELVFVGAFTSAMLVFWFSYAVDFHGVLLQGGIPSGLVATPWPFIGLTAVALAGVALLLRLRRRSLRTTGFRVGLPSDRSLLRDGAIIFVGIVAGLSALLLVPLPATAQHIAPGTLLWFSPFIVAAAFSAGSRRLVTTSRIGPFVLMWSAALGLSAVFALATNNPVLLPSRHAEYLVIPLGLLVAIVLGYLGLRLERSHGRRGLVAFGAAVVVLVAANAAIAYPPPQYFGGFQEGLTVEDSGMWMWSGAALPGPYVVASDHRLSSMFFGFDGYNATWQDTPALFDGSNWSVAAAELRAIPAPRCPYLKAVDLVAVDSTMYQGVALDPAQQANPLSTVSQGWFQGAPFVPLYLNGPQAIYWVDGPVGSAVASNTCQGS
ncbi:MAG TPA: hypothetical protein VGV89_04985 [Thermoplasmata archaeon]|nr:hypothetical protein [Thermoplasmata archaeon]